MARANVIVMFISIPVIIVQFAAFIMVHSMEILEPTWNSVILIVVVLLGVVMHELIHGITW